MFSSITIDESTTIPIPKINPDIVIMFTVKFIKDIHINVIKIEIGSESPMIKEHFKFRKKMKITITASKAPVIAEE